MLVWILLGLLVSLPWVAPRIARACATSRRWTYVGTAGHPDFQNGFGNAEQEMRVSGHLRRAKAEGVGQPPSSSYHI